MEWKVPLPPPTMTTPASPDVNPASGLEGTLGRRDIWAFETRSSSAVTKIFPSETLVLKECRAAGAGASSISPVQTLKHAVNGHSEWIRLGQPNEEFTSVPWATRASVRGTNGNRGWIDAPYESPVRNEDTLCQRCSVVGTVRTRRVELITQPGQQNLSIPKVDFFPKAAE